MLPCPLQFPPFPGGLADTQPASSLGVFQSTPAPLLSQQLPQQQGMPPFRTTAPLISTSSEGSSSNSAPSQSLVNSSGSSLITIPPPPQQQAKGQATPTSSGLAGLGSMGGGLGSDFLGLGLPKQPMQQAPPPVVQATPPARQPPMPDPLTVLDNLVVALETIKPGDYIV